MIVDSKTFFFCDSAINEVLQSRKDAEEAKAQKAIVFLLLNFDF